MSVSWGTPLADGVVASPSLCRGQIDAFTHISRTQTLPVTSGPLPHSRHSHYDIH
ncbi:hypothetical protein SNOG_07158 [Parastagonospora nodorum SN15]|uniref:Uncharacterized protein n=1 Tax=Phaeosphaeria nodorum (strain SN15 / ATCC MYA-4574 / FGSC 10173) TaxID=321614 RepID=Q0UM56_PHANO|nr:hypothetical protein SNOG_07158 [Parastagonospora nodorum SN15]EAT85809.1 hypothetical protein SNOG_07158 [Parastagonospora nodorum SN15]